MAEDVAYKVITGTQAEIEKQLNEMAKYGWRVVSAAHGASPLDIAVILEMRSAAPQP